MDIGNIETLFANIFMWFVRVQNGLVLYEE